MNNINYKYRDVMVSLSFWVVWGAGVLGASGGADDDINISNHWKTSFEIITYNKDNMCTRVFPLSEIKVIVNKR